MGNLIALVSGVIFGIGLTVSQMINPQKVINFLDIMGNWDPSLLFVMLAALLTFGTGYQFFIKKRHVPIVEKAFHFPNKVKVDKKLVMGAALFGFGWGLGGLCPGPALANIASGDSKVYGFIIMMLIGMKCSDILVSSIGKNSKA